MCVRNKHAVSEGMGDDVTDHLLQNERDDGIKIDTTSVFHYYFHNFLLNNHLSNDIVFANDSRCTHHATFLHRRRRHSH